MKAITAPTAKLAAAIALALAAAAPTANAMEGGMHKIHHLLTRPATFDVVASSRAADVPNLGDKKAATPGDGAPAFAIARRDRGVDTTQVATNPKSGR